jgi:hypothetical protein
MFRPIQFDERLAEALRPLGLAAAASDDLLDRDGGCQQRCLQFVDGFRKVDLQDGLCVGLELDLEAFESKRRTSLVSQPRRPSGRAGYSASVAIGRGSVAELWL